MTGENIEIWRAQLLCQPEGFQLITNEGVKFFMAGSPETRDSWHRGSVAGGVGNDMPLGASGRFLRAGVWTARVPWSGSDCQLVMEVGDALPTDALTPYIRIHPLSCALDGQIKARDHHDSSLSRNTVRRGDTNVADIGDLVKTRKTSIKGLGFDDARDLHMDANRHSETHSAGRRATSTSLTLNISDTVKLASTAPPLFDFTWQGAVVASYVPVLIPPSPTIQFWLFQPDQACYLSKWPLKCGLIISSLRDQFFAACFLT
jgi:hypothetical protein